MRLLFQRDEYTRRSLPLRKYYRECISLYETKDDKVPFVGSLWKRGRWCNAYVNIETSAIYRDLCPTRLTRFPGDFWLSPQLKVSPKSNRKTLLSLRELWNISKRTTANLIKFALDTANFVSSFVVRVFRKWEENATVRCDLVENGDGRREKLGNQPGVSHIR